MTRDNDTPGFLADNVTLVARDGIGVGHLIALGQKLAEYTDDYMLGVITDDQGEPVTVIGHQSLDLVVTLEANPKLIRWDRG